MKKVDNNHKYKYNKLNIAAETSATKVDNCLRQI